MGGSCDGTSSVLMPLFSELGRVLVTQLPQHESISIFAAASADSSAVSSAAASADTLAVSSAASAHLEQPVDEDRRFVTNGFPSRPITGTPTRAPPKSTEGSYPETLGKHCRGKRRGRGSRR